MTVTVQQVLDELRRFAPPELAQDWDNVGLLVDAGRPVTGVLTALDITAEVVREAAALGCELIVAHHPVIFHPIKALAPGDVPALLVFNAVFGGSVTSKLFMNVRERLQLCYYASSGLDWQKGLLLVSSGVAFDKLGAARDEIFTQLEAIKRGEVTAEELEAARLSVRNRYASMGDDPFALESHYLSMNIAGSDASPEDIAAACDGVTAEDVVRIAQNTDCDAIYYLKAGEGKSDDDQA